jgi:YbbR domain-containing protein
MNKIIRNIFVKNWGLKLFSFLLALVIWVTIIPEEKLSFEKSVTVPLELHNLPSGMEIIEKPPSTIDVIIKAPHRLIDLINSETVRARLELGSARVEQTEFPLNRTMIILPQGAEVKEFSPSQVRMRLERSREILMKVDPDLIGLLPENLELVKVEVIPNEVSIIGPESKVKETDKVKTSPIDLSSLTSSIEIKTDLILPDPDLRVASYKTIITVRIIIEEKTPEETVPVKKKSAY